MLKPNQLLLLLAAGVLTFSLNACKDDDPAVQDTEPPVISISLPADDTEYEPGEQIKFEATLEDNVELASYNITIHSNFDGHTHGRVAESPLAYDKSFTISGKKATVAETIDIPADATPGAYHFIVKAIDKAGNATNEADGSTKEVDIEIHGHDDHDDDHDHDH